MSLDGDRLRLHMRDGEVAGTLLVPAALRPGVLMVHGWGGNRQQYLEVAHPLTALGCVCLTFDLTGHSATSARRQDVTRQENLDDVTAAYDFLAAHPQVKESAIAVIGSSYGGYLAALLTAIRPVAWLALRAPALYRDRDWDAPKQQLARLQDLPHYRRTVIAPEANRALRACACFPGDVLIVESERDTIVPRPTLTSYRRAFRVARSLNYRMIANANHALSDHDSQRAYAAILIEWISAQLLDSAALGRNAPPQAVEEPEVV
ncbi:alpha/beta hydrolase family protein [Dyella sp. KRB-257]|uniref:alpha/beta hydrolase family protein n=1 Tax=Dyella sp. KRB-257 TaxID=3400915 RepID=UPI003C038766